MNKDPNQEAKIKKAMLQPTALEYRMAGATYDKIAEKLNISKATARRWILDALEDLRKERIEHADDLLQLELERLDMATLAISNQVMAGNLAAIPAWQALVKQRVDLQGLTPPTKNVNTIQGPNGGPVNMAFDMNLGQMSDAQLNQLIAQTAGLLDLLQGATSPPEAPQDDEQPES